MIGNTISTVSKQKLVQLLKRRTIMSVGAIGTTPSPIITSQVTSTTAPAPVPEKTQTVKTPAYTVELTGTALAKSLKLAGQNPAQIALKMGIDVKTVDQYLSIKVATATPTPAPVTPAPAKQATPAPTTTASTQSYSPAEEAKEPASEKATEAAQGKK